MKVQAKIIEVKIQGVQVHPLHLPASAHKEREWKEHPQLLANTPKSKIPYKSLATSKFFINELNPRYKYRPA